MAIDINITTPNLQDVTDSGNTTNNDVAFTDNAGILLENTSRLREGTIDSGAGGGIAQICAVGYELKWEAGSQYVMDGNGTYIREVNHKFNTIPTSTNDKTQGFYVGSRWILDNGDVYVCTDWTENAAVWEKQNSISDLVPYTGATADVDLGNQDLYTNKVWLYDAPNDAHGSIHLTDNNFHIEDSDGHKMLVIEDGFMQIHLSDTIQSNLYTTNLTAIRDHYLPNASGTIALTSDIPNIQVNITSPTGGNQLEYDSTTSVWKNVPIQYTIELVAALTVDFYAPYNMKINSVSNVLNAPTITIQDDGAAYTLGNTIAIGSKVTVTASTLSVVNLNITK